MYVHNTITEHHRFVSILFPLGLLEAFSFGFVKALSALIHNTIAEQHRFGSILFPLGFLGFSFGFVKAVSALIHNDLDNVIL